MTKREMRKAYKTKWGVNQWKVSKWDEKVACYREEGPYTYYGACTIMRQAREEEKVVTRLAALPAVNVQLLTAIGGTNRRRDAVNFKT